MFIRKKETKEVKNMIKNNKKVIKKVIYCLVLLVLTLILKSKVTYAVTITYYPNMEVYTTKEFFVKNTTLNVVIYTKKHTFVP